MLTLTITIYMYFKLLNLFDWQVSVTAREDVPSFGPPLPNPAVFRKVSEQQQQPILF